MGAITIAQWIQIAGLVMGAGPEIRSLLTKLGPVFEQLVHAGETAMATGASHHDAVSAAADGAHRYANQGGFRTHGGHQDI